MVGPDMRKLSLYCCHGGGLRQLEKMSFVKEETVTRKARRFLYKCPACGAVKCVESGFPADPVETIFIGPSKPSGKEP